MSPIASITLYVLRNHSIIKVKELTFGVARPELPDDESDSLDDELDEDEEVDADRRFKKYLKKYF